ncbi:MAG: hypothetical protein RL033_428 [Pseudomonadota bacterium]
MGGKSPFRNSLAWLLTTAHTGDPAAREQSRFVARILIASLPFVVTVGMWLAPSLLEPAHPFSNVAFRASIGSVLATGIAYLLNRRGALYAAPAVLLASWTAMLSWAASTYPALLIFSPLLQLIALATLPQRAALVLGAAMGVLLHLVPVLAGAAPLEQVALSFCLSAFFLTVAGVTELHHRGLERLRRAALEQNERWLATTLSSIGDAVLTVDARDNIAFMNPVAESLTGWAASEAKGRHLAEIFRIVNELSGLPVDDPVAQVRRTGKRAELDEHTVLLGKDGTRRPIAHSGAPIAGPDAQLSGVVLVFRDVTEERAVQDRLQHSQRLDALGQLAGGVAHDFNNLLTVIGGSTELALDQLQPTDGAREDLENIRDATTRAVALTSQLLAFSRRQVMQTTALDLNAAILGTVQILERLLKPNVRIMVQLAADAGWIRVDPTQLEQVVFNLAINAGDAMPDGGTLEFSSARVHPPTRSKTSNGNGSGTPHVRLRVTDTGVGMTEPTRLRIFEPFFTTKERGRGTGLGLSTVYGIVQQSGGSISVQSAPGRGSTFEILFPCVEPPGDSAREQQPQAPNVVRNATLTAFLVEDDAMVRQLVRRTLEAAGYHLLDADSGEAALARLHAGELDTVEVLVVDLVLPGMPGLQVARECVERHPHLPVLFISGYADEIVARQGLGDRRSHFLAKPFTPAQLRAALEQLRAGKGSVSPRQARAPSATPRG